MLTPDKPLEIPVTVDRQRGFASEIEVVVTGLPEKVTVESVVSAKDGETAKAVKFVLKAEAGVNFSGRIRILGRVKSEPPVEKSASATLTAFNTTTRELWLTVTAPAAK